MIEKSTWIRYEKTDTVDKYVSLNWVTILDTDFAQLEISKDGSGISINCIYIAAGITIELRRESVLRLANLFNMQNSDKFDSAAFGVAVHFCSRFCKFYKVADAKT